ncbi:MAG TPA: hypothetical protein VGJ93_01085 [Desulfuromonadaceae bacterium]|jgi:hypothetical protein
MKKKILAVTLTVFSALTISGCGGGGGGGGAIAPATVTKAVTKVYVYGNMSSPASFGNLSSNARIATVQSKMSLPAEVMVNYSSAPGATAGLCFLRKGVIVPSGNTLLSASDFSFSTFDIASRVLTLNMINSGRQRLKTNTNGNGVEFATVNFTLTTPGVPSGLIPLFDQAAAIGEEMPDLSLAYLLGRRINFVTTFL